MDRIKHTHTHVQAFLRTINRTLFTTISSSLSTNWQAVLDKNSLQLLRRAVRILARRTKTARMGERSPSVLRIELLLYSSLVSRSRGGNRTETGMGGWKTKGKGRNRRPTVGHVNWTDDAAKSRVPRTAERPRVKSRLRRFVRN